MDEKKRILIVDDEQINLEFFEVMLSKLGFDIHLAENGREALESVRRIKPDLIILDNIMPKLTGWEVTRILKNDPEYTDFADIPIIMFSALDDVRDKVEGLELGADDYITKPFNFTEVLARIRVVLRTHELIKQIENREKRIKVSQTALEAIVDTEKQAKQIVDALRNQAGTPVPVQEALGKLTELFGDMDARIGKLKAEADKLSGQAKDLHALRRTVRGDMAQTK